eukprot:GHVN01035089.1.p2 GENE.GHVN01035089.1~~GHVN01035089.1.p2  ORF type:complete len:717 (+),score=118.34 GHVN01035089.1:700-2850(+)
MLYSTHLALLERSSRPCCFTSPEAIYARHRRVDSPQIVASLAPHERPAPASQLQPRVSTPGQEEAVEIANDDAVGLTSGEVEELTFETDEPRYVGESEFLGNQVDALSLSDGPSVRDTKEDGNGGGREASKSSQSSVFSQASASLFYYPQSLSRFTSCEELELESTLNQCLQYQEEEQEEQVERDKEGEPAHKPIYDQNDFEAQEDDQNEYHENEVFGESYSWGAEHLQWGADDPQFVSQEDACDSSQGEYYSAPHEDAQFLSQEDACDSSQGEHVTGLHEDDEDRSFTQLEEYQQLENESFEDQDFLEQQDENSIHQEEFFADHVETEAEEDDPPKGPNDADYSSHELEENGLHCTDVGNDYLEYSEHDNALGLQEQVTYEDELYACQQQVQQDPVSEETVTQATQPLCAEDDTEGDPLCTKETSITEEATVGEFDGDGKLDHYSWEHIIHQSGLPVTQSKNVWSRSTSLPCGPEPTIPEEQEPDAGFDEVDSEELADSLVWFENFLERRELQKKQAAEKRSKAVSESNQKEEQSSNHPDEGLFNLGEFIPDAPSFNSPLEHESICSGNNVSNPLSNPAPHVSLETPSKENEEKLGSPTLYDESLETFMVSLRERRHRFLSVVVGGQPDGRVVAPEQWNEGCNRTNMYTNNDESSTNQKQTIPSPDAPSGCTPESVQSSSSWLSVSHIMQEVTSDTQTSQGQTVLATLAVPEKQG